MQRLLGFPPQHLAFPLSYLRQKSSVERLENGLIAITAAGVDKVIEQNLVLLDHFVNACGGYGDETIFQALNRGFLPKVRERKCEVLGWESQQTLHLNEADSGLRRVTRT